MMSEADRLFLEGASGVQATCAPDQLRGLAFSFLMAWRSGLPVRRVSDAVRVVNIEKEAADAEAYVSERS